MKRAAAHEILAAADGASEPGIGRGKQRSRRSQLLLNRPHLGNDLAAQNGVDFFINPFRPRGAQLLGGKGGPASRLFGRARARIAVDANQLGPARDRPGRQQFRAQTEAQTDGAQFCGPA